ncbi:biopolymer transporter ExbD [bacterium]|nr:biopolymer transporter ExbD [bacterium]
MRRSSAIKKLHLFPKRTKKTHRIDITSLIDVIFILLIFFAVSTTLVLNRQGIEMTLPSAKSAVKHDKKNLVLSIDKDQNIFLDNAAIEKKELKQLIQTYKSEKNDLSVTLEADKLVPYDLIISVLDEVRMGGCYSVVLNVKQSS